MSKTKVKFYPVADRLPLRQEDIDRLADSIKEHGLQVPIKRLKSGEIIDGRNRYLACEKAGIEPVFETVEPEDVLAYSLLLNGDRRDLTKVERACWAALDWDEMGLNGKNSPKGNQHTGKSAKVQKYTLAEHAQLDRSQGFIKFAKSYKVGESYAKKALAILNHWNADKLREVMVSGDLDETYNQMRGEKKAAEERRRDDEMIARHPDLKEKVGNGNLSREDALGAAERREKERIEEEEARKRADRAANEQFRNILHYGTVEPFDWVPDIDAAGGKEKIIAEIDHVIGNLNKIKANIR